MMIMIVGGATDAVDGEENVDAVVVEIKKRTKRKKLLNLQVYLIILGMTHQLKP